MAVWQKGGGFERKSGESPECQESRLGFGSASKKVIKGKKRETNLVLGQESDAEGNLFQALESQD